MRLRCRVAAGQPGTPLLLINGVGGNLDMWSPLVPALGDRTVISFDAPGTGGSSTPPVPLTMWHLAALTDVLVTRLGFDSIDVLGMSWGGILAQALAILRPRRVRRLVLAVTNPGIGGIPAHPGILRIMLSPKRYYSRDYLLSVGPRLYGGRARADPASLLRGAEARLGRPPSVTGYMAQLWATATYTGVPWLRLVRAPTLVVAGDDDPLVPVVNARLLAALIPHTELYRVAGGGHLLLLDEPERVGPAVARFLDSPGASVDVSPDTTGTRVRA
jgi:poly(3-hydroxyalkanoate) depolymerase